MFGKPSNIKIYTSGICRRKDKYLLLRINKSYNICPGDWEWVTCSIRLSDSAQNNVSSSPLRKNALNTLYKQTGLAGRIVKFFPFHRWFDNESKLLFVLYPVLIYVDNTQITLAKNKFAEYKWVASEDIIKHDRKNYLTDFVNHLNRFGGF
jgi:hypothetical protein